MLLHQDLSFSKTLNPNFSPFPPRPKTLSLTLKPQFLCTTLSFPSQTPQLWRQDASLRRDTRSFAGRSKKEPGAPSPGRTGGYRRPKRKARIRRVNIEESPYFRLKNSNKNHPDNLTEDQLNQIGLGYDYMARFMDKDDPNLKHPYDWYRYGEYGPYSWRGVVVGEPVLGGITDECVTLYSQVKDDAEWDKIEQHEMAVDFGERLKQMNKEAGFRHFWVFVRHPKWRLNEMPWEQWTLVSEVVVEAGKQRLDKWNLMGRLGNQARKLITRCAAWFRPDIIYVKRPVFQCRFEPQDDFFRGLMPFLDPKTEKDFLFELENEDGSVQLCTYYEGLCKIVKVSQKAFVDDVVNAYEKMSDERKSECLGFLMRNHPVQLLHPYTKEWKAKLEEIELGCDAPDDDEEYGKNETEYTEWIEDDGDGDGDDQDDVVLDMEGGGVDQDDDDESISEEEDDEEEEEEEENEQYWEKKFKKALSSSEEMENLVKWSVDRTDEIYKKQSKAMMQGEEGKGKSEADGDETALRGVRAKVSPKEWKIVGIGRWGRRIKKAKIPPGLFLRAAVRPFRYRNLVKEIVLTRHAILDGDIGGKD
ncbi:hypothetical protein Peur_000691 [Populus x canadensis]